MTNLPPKKVRALEALLLTGSVMQAAQAAGVARQTVHAWLADETFATELRRLEGQSLANLGRRLMALGDLASKALFDALQPGQPMNARLRAAQIVTERGPALAELSALVARLEALERRTV